MRQLRISCHIAQTPCRRIHCRIIVALVLRTKAQQKTRLNCICTNITTSHLCIASDSLVAQGKHKLTSRIKGRALLSHINTIRRGTHNFRNLISINPWSARLPAQAASSFVLTNSVGNVLILIYLGLLNTIYLA